MSDSNTQEPTMEEILASIRRIISEDEAPAAASPEPAAAAAPAPAALEEEEDDDVLELTEPAPVPPPPPTVLTPSSYQGSSEVMGDLDISFPPGPAQKPPAAAAPSFHAPEPEPEPAPAYRSTAAEPDYSAGYDDEPLVSEPIVDRAASYFDALGRNVIMPAEGRTLEHVVSELLRPMLKDWLDRHLPSIVEAKVQAEVERISRRR